MNNLARVLFILMLVIAVIGQAGNGGDNPDLEIDGGGGDDGEDGDEQSGGITKISQIAGAITGSVTTSLMIGFVIYLICTKHTCCPCHKFQSLRSELNEVNPGQMSQKQYRKNAQQLIFSLDNSKNNKNFSFTQEENILPLSQVSAHIIEEEDRYLTKIEVSGTDIFGNWESEGYILCKDGKMFMWLYKQYKDKAKVGQSGNMSHLVYEMTKFCNHEFSGIWYYLGFQGDSKYSGKWKLQRKVHQGSNQLLFQVETTLQISNNAS